MSALQVGFLKGEIERRDAKIESNAKVIAALREALQQLVERIDVNGGIGEYKGGPAFVMANARAALAATDEQTVGEK